MATEQDLTEYLVVADMVTIATGRMRKDNEPEVIRVERGTTINALPDNESITDLLGMGGVVVKKTAVKDMAALSKKGSKYRPTVVKDDEGPDHLRLRLTVAGASTMLLGGEEPEAAIAEVVPTHAPNPDLSIPVVDASV